MKAGLDVGVGSSSRSIGAHAPKDEAWSAAHTNGSPSAHSNSLADLSFGEIAPDDPTYKLPWISKPRPGKNFHERSITLEGEPHTVWVAKETKSRPAVVYAERATIQLLAHIGYHAQGDGGAAATIKSLDTIAFVYHGGSLSLDAIGIPKGAMVLEKAPEGESRADARIFGARIREELVHAKGTSPESSTPRQLRGSGELPAHLEAQCYLLRTGVRIRELSPDEVANHIWRKGLEPTVHIVPGTVITPSLGIPPGGGFRPVMHRPVEVSPLTAAEQHQRIRAGQIEQAQRAAAAAVERQRESQRAAAEQANRVAAQAEREDWIRKNMPALIIPFIIGLNRFLLGDYAKDSREGEAGVSAAGMSSPTGGDQRQRGQQQQQRDGRDGQGKQSFVENLSGARDVFRNDLPDS